VGCVPAYSGRGQPPKRPTRESVHSLTALAADLPEGAWQRLQVSEDAVGPLVFEFAAVRVWAVRHRQPGPPIWVLIRRSLEESPEVKYYVSNGGAETPLSVLALVACTRHQVEDFFEDTKGYLGLSQYETRSWVGWHHHMTLVGLAHLFVSVTRLRLQKSSGPDAGPHDAIAGGRLGGTGAEIAASGGVGGLPHPPQHSGQSIT
jgi:hypothetical protein